MNASPGPDWTTSSTLRPTCRAMNPRIAKTTSPEKRLAPNSNFVKNSKLNQFRPNGNEFYCTPVVKINLSYMYVQRDSKSGEHEAIQIISFTTSKQKICQIQDYRIEKTTITV